MLQDVHPAIRGYKDGQEQHSMPPIAVAALGKKVGASTGEMGHSMRMSQQMGHSKWVTA